MLWISASTQGQSCYCWLLAESNSSNPVVLNRFSVQLASAIPVITLICLTGLYSLFFRTDSTLSFSTRIVLLLGRIPAFLELFILFGWIPVMFMLVAGKGLFPIAEEARFLLSLTFAYAGFSMITATLISSERRKLLRERILMLGISTFVGLLAVEFLIRIISPPSVFPPRSSLFHTRTYL